MYLIHLFVYKYIVCFDTRQVGLIMARQLCPRAGKLCVMYLRCQDTCKYTRQCSIDKIISICPVYSEYCVNNSISLPVELVTSTYFKKKIWIVKMIKTICVICFSGERRLLKYASILILLKRQFKRNALCQSA